MASDFHAAYPDLIVKPEAVGTDVDLAKKVSAAIAANNAPELVLADRLSIAQFIRQDGLLILDEFINDPQVGLSDDDRSDFFPGLLDEGVFVDPKRSRALLTPTPPPTATPSPDQPIDFDLLILSTPFPTPGPIVVPITNTFAVPFDVSAIALYSNLDLLKSAKYTAPPRTWADFSRMARESTKGEAYGWATSPNPAVFQAMLVSNGGRLVDESSRRSIVNNAAGLRTVAMISELSKAGASKYFDSVEQARADFLSGRVAFFFARTDELASLTHAIQDSPKNFSWAVTNIPIVQGGGNTSLMLGRDLAILRTDSEHQRAAWFFIRWLTASQQTARWTRASGALPLRASALQYLVNDALPDIGLKQLKENFAVTPPFFVPRSSAKYSPQMDDTIHDLWRTIALSKDTNLQSALDGAATRINQLLAAP